MLDANVRSRVVATAMAVALVLAGAGLARAAATPPKPAAAPAPLFHDSHFHLTNYIQEGLTAREWIQTMGSKVGRSTIFGLPLQQQWSYRVDGDDAPKYYLDSDSPLYFYSFTDAYIAMQYRSLPKADQARIDPMITGFNPTDMYAADHIRRVLQTFPGVFTGIGEFSVHKEFVAAKIPGFVASLTDPALDRIFDFTAETGLIAILHNDIAKPFPKAYTGDYLADLKALFRRHPKSSIIWAHVGLGRIVQPIEEQVVALEQILADPAYNHVNFDISWDEVAKYALTNEASMARVAAMFDKYPDRFLFGTDTVAPRDPKAYFAVYEMWEPIWGKVAPETKRKITTGNYERLFDAARAKVRAWEKANVK